MTDNEDERQQGGVEVCETLGWEMFRFQTSPKWCKANMILTLAIPVTSGTTLEGWL